jgi:hypothetical protein
MPVPEVSIDNGANETNPALGLGARNPLWVIKMPSRMKIKRLERLSAIKIKSAPYRWSVPSAHASGEWLFGCIGPRWIAIDSSM